MPCLALILAVFSPRLAILALWLFDDVLSRAYDSAWLPIVGFFLLPWTTFAYAVAWSVGTNEVAGFEWFFVVLAFLADLGSFGGAAKRRD